MSKRRARAAELPDRVALAGTILASAFDSAGVAVLITDLDLRPPGPLIRYVNPVFEDITGYAAEEVIGRSPGRLLGPLSDQGALGRLLQSLHDGRDFRAEMVNHRKSGEEYLVEWTISPVRDEHGDPTYWIALLRDVSHARLARQSFATELEHRTRNLLATVRSIASRSLPETAEAEKFADRLAALGRVQGLMSKAEKDDDEVDLETLVQTELAAHAIPEDRATVGGETIAVPRTHIDILALAIHELATNAREHGALASEQGAVSVDWFLNDGHDRRLTLVWVESGAPRLAEEEPRRGYGRELIERALPFSLRAKTRMEFRPAGLICRIELPLPAEPDNALPQTSRVAYLNGDFEKFRRDDGEKPTR